jgi:hypothetical protein
MRPKLAAAIKREVWTWNPKLAPQVWSDAEARASLETLFSKNCDPAILLELLRLFCGVGLHVAEIQKSAKRFLKRTQRLALRLKEDAAEVRHLDRHFELGLDFPDEMDNFSEFLSGINADEVKSTALSRGSGLQTELVDAVRFVKILAGRAHYREVARLVSAISGDLVDEGNLRKKVDNYEETSMFHGPRHSRELLKMADRSRAKCIALRRGI